MEFSTKHQNELEFWFWKSKFFHLMNWNSCSCEERISIQSIPPTKLQKKTEIYPKIEKTHSTEVAHSLFNEKKPKKKNDIDYLKQFSMR